MAAGFALRINGTCGSSEVDCGATVDPYRVCCPGGSFCPHAYNVDCCPTKSNCTASLVKKPKCANATWDLYDNGGYFCCMPGLRGYAAAGSDGCAAPGYEFQEGETLLKLLSAGSDPSSMTAASSTTAKRSTLATTATTTSVPVQSAAQSASTAQTSSPPQGSSSIAGGAVAGGVVGGVAVLALIAVAAWWFATRRSRGKAHELADTAKTDDAADGASPCPSTPSKVHGELPSPHGASEMSSERGISELPGQGIACELQA